jgi:transcriptional regulator with XRE-family HTH domain
MNRCVVRPDGLAIKHLRNLRGWTQKDLARRAGYTERLIRKAESGGALGIQTAMDIAEAFSQDLHKVAIDEFVSTRDRMGTVHHFLQSFSLYGREMVKHVQQELTHDFSMRIAVFRGSNSFMPADWFNISELNFLLDAIVLNFSMDKGVMNTAYTEGAEFVSVRYHQRLLFAGRTLEPFWVNLHFHFKSHKIESIEVEYDTFAVSRIFSQIHRLAESTCLPGNTDDLGNTDDTVCDSQKMSTRATVNSR